MKCKQFHKRVSHVLLSFSFCWVRFFLYQKKKKKKKKFLMQKILEKSCIRQNPVPSNVAELDFWKKEKCISLCGPEHKIDNDVSITFMAYKIIIMTTFCKSIIFITLFKKKKKKKKNNRFSSTFP